MVIALNPTIAREVVIESEKGSPSPTVFLVRPPTHAWVEAKPVGERKLTEVVADHLDGWKGLMDASGAEVPFPGSGASALDLLPASVVQELGVACIGMTFLSKEDKGK